MSPRSLPIAKIAFRHQNKAAPQVFLELRNGFRAAVDFLPGGNCRESETSGGWAWPQPVAGFRSHFRTGSLAFRLPDFRSTVPATTRTCRARRHGHAHG